MKMAAMATVIVRMRIQDSGEGENHSKGVSKKKLQSIIMQYLHQQQWRDHIIFIVYVEVG